MFATKIQRLASNQIVRQTAFNARSSRTLTRTPPALVLRQVANNAPAVSQCRGFASTPEDHHQGTMTFSTMAQNPGVLEKPLKVLDRTTVQKIKQELNEVDANHDGRYVTKSIGVCLVFLPITL